MTKKVRRSYAIAAAYDTETTTIGEGSDARSFQSLYIFNDLRKKKMRTYTPEGDVINFYRNADDALEFVSELIDWGFITDKTPIVCAYNLTFDLQPFLCRLANKYDVHVNAQSSTSVYTYDLYEGETCVLRFWDTFFMERGGLAAMGNICGVAKASGDWDYSLIRTNETELTEDELFYASRDVQVIPAFLRYTLESNDFLSESDLGVSCLTKTSLVRLQAKRQIGQRSVETKSGRQKLINLFEATCKRELPKTYEQYARQKAAFRGGFTFTAAKTASVVVYNVASLDVTSMHHAFINGRYVPTGFKEKDAATLQVYLNSCINTPLSEVLEFYQEPFSFAFHACIRFTNIRIKPGTAFEDWGIALAPQAKFALVSAAFNNDEANIAADEAIRGRGYHDAVTAPTFALGKLYAAKEAVMYLSELELWAMSRVYTWDKMEALNGEVSTTSRIPPDYVTLQSNYLFTAKQDAKKINNNYHAGEAYGLDIPETTPGGIATSLRTGSISKDLVKSWYSSTVKGSFNGIYGTQAQDIFKPGFTTDETGRITVDKNEVLTPETFAARRADIKHPRVWYQYGLRIVGGSRMHLIIAIELLYVAFGNRITVTGGDTDSLKIRCDADVTDDMLTDALKPLHDAITTALNRVQLRNRALFPDIASTLDGVGTFDVEDCGNSKRYVKHMEAWNKARVSEDTDGKIHVTCAGLPMPEAAYNLQDFMREMSSVYSFETVAPLCLGYNVTVDNSICHYLGTNRPSPDEMFAEDVTDYKGETRHVVAPAAVALYETERVLGELDKYSNYSSMIYLQQTYNRKVDRRSKSLYVDESGKPIIRIDEADRFTYMTIDGIHETRSFLCA